MVSDVYTMVTIYCSTGYNGRGDLRGAIECAQLMIKRTYVESGRIGECFAFLHDQVKGIRYIVYLDDDLQIITKRLK